MKKITIALSALLLSAGGLFSQNYYAVKATNYVSAGYDLNKITATSGTNALLSVGSNDLMSAVQTIPFSFNFYGTPVTTYRASDNGYITFNTTATTSVAPSLTALPTAGDPNNAIYTFFHDFELKSAPNATFPVKVISYTTGTTPNRVHHIQWFGISRKGEAIAANANVYAFAISLFEGANGNFDITYNGGFGSTAPAGVIGCENADGTVAKMLGDAVGNYKASETIATSIYQYRYGVQDSLDVKVLATNIGKRYKTGDPLTIQAAVTNIGSKAITSLSFNYSINAGPTQSTPLTGLNIAGNGDNSVTLSHTIPWTSGAAGSESDIRVWVSSPNAGVDSDTTNNQLTALKVLRNNGTGVAPRVLIEEATGAWCQHCPDAHTYIDDLRDLYKDDVVIAVEHNQDQMTNAEVDKVVNQYNVGFPSAYFNRSLLNGATSIGLSRGSWNSAVSVARNAVAPANVSISNVLFVGGKITFTVDAEFLDYYNGDIRIGAMIKEDIIRGVGTGYDQVIAGNYTANPSHVYYQKSSPMVGYPHKDVIISIPSGAWGTAGSVPTLVTPGQKVSFNYSYNLPTNTYITLPSSSTFPPTGKVDGRNKPANIWLIGFVADYNETNANDRKILNVYQRQMWNKALDVTEADVNTNTVLLVPNNADNEVTVVLNYNSINAQNAVVTITNSLGQVVGVYNFNELNAGLNRLSINTSTFSNGIYNVNVSGGILNLNEKLVVTH